MNIFIDDGSAPSSLTSIVYGTFTGSGATGTQDITGLGGAPSLVLIWANGGSNGAGSARPSFGAAIPGGNKVTIAAKSEHAAATMITSRALRSDQALMRIAISSDTQDGVIDTLTSISDGFRVNWTVANTATYRYIAFPTALSIAVGTFDIAAATGTQDITGLGFDPALVLFLGSIENTTEGVQAESNFSIGAGVSATRRAGGNWYARDNVAAAVAKGQITGTKVIVQTNGSANDCAVDYEGSISGGFRVDVTTAPAASTRIGYVAIGGTGFSADVGTFVNKTSPDGNLAYTGVGFQPDTLFLFGRGTTALDALQNATQMAIGAAKSTSNRGFAGYGETDGALDSSIRLNAQTNAAIGSISGNGTIANVADLVSMDADGFTLSWTSTTAAATYHGYVAMRYSP